MPEIQTPPSQPSQPIKPIPSPVPPPPTNQAQKPTKQSTASPFKLALLTFILGIISGILLFATYPKLMNKQQPAATSPNELSLPRDATKIQNSGTPAEPTIEASPSASLNSSRQSSDSGTTITPTPAKL